MAKYKENRKIPDFISTKLNDETPFDSSTGLETEDYTCFGLSNQDTRVLSLKALFPDGAIALIQYSRMMSPIKYNGKNEITIETPTLWMRIEGRKLVPLIDFLAQQRLAWIRSSSLHSPSDAIMMSKDEPEIIAIQIKSKGKMKKDNDD